MPSKERLLQYCNTLLRKDESFKNLEYLHEYQRGISILNELPYVELVSNVPIDSMHAIYLGIMRQLIRHWVGDKGRNNKYYKLSQDQIEFISSTLESLKHVLPYEFNRRCRSLTYWRQWKATEFRHFLLYFGPFILQNVLKSDVYSNFLKLHISTVILTNPTLVKDSVNVEYSEALNVDFIHSFQTIYGKENVTFNVHALLYLAKDTKIYGSLDQFSAFPFENYLCTIKKLLRKGEKPLQQISRRLTEYEFIRDNLHPIIVEKGKGFQVEKEHSRNIFNLGERGEKQYKILKANSWRLDIDDGRNNSVMLNDSTVVTVVNIIKINNKLHIVGRKYNTTRDLFMIPGFRSGCLGIQIVSEPGENEYWPCESISCKIFKVAGTNGYIVYPIIHTFIQ